MFENRFLRINRLKFATLPIPGGPGRLSIKRAPKFSDKEDSGAFCLRLDFLGRG